MRAHDTGEPAAFVTVVATEGSTPQRAGARMLVHADGRIVGTIGGGCVEAEMVRRARNAIQTRRSELAEYDLRVRGPGDFLGVRQSGLPELHLATLENVGLIESARQAAAEVLAEDPELARPEHAGLAQQLQAFAHRVGEPN